MTKQEENLIRLIKDMLPILDRFIDTNITNTSLKRELKIKIKDMKKIVMSYLKDSAWIRYKREHELE